MIIRDDERFVNDRFRYLRPVVMESNNHRRGVIKWKNMRVDGQFCISIIIVFSFFFMNACSSV